MPDRLAQVGKWAWVALVVTAAGWLIAGSWQEISEMLRRISLPMLAAGILLTVLAKAGLAENARIAALRNGIAIDLVTCARLYNLSQLGKYLPGSIWQFVGRAAAYRKLGAGYGAIRDALLVESLWIVAGASATGVLLAGPRIPGLVVSSLDPMLRWWLGGLFAACVLLVAGLALWKRAVVARYAQLAVPTARVLLVQGFIWSMLGLAFWVLARACGLEVAPLFATGLFAAAYAVGFLVPFAPAGLGVRDAILTLGLLPYVPPGEALVVTVLARVVYLVVDVGLVLVQEPWFARVRYSGAARPATSSPNTPPGPPDPDNRSRRA